MATIHCVRHGQSEANAGAIVNSDRFIKLTQKGLDEAIEASKRWTFAPDRIIASNFVRAQQTAQPTCERFPDVTYEVWDSVGEHELFCFERWKDGCTRCQRQEYFGSYLKAADAHAKHGETAESFSEFVERIRKALNDFAQLPEEENVFLFSHSMFLCGLYLILKNPELTSTELMQRFSNLYNLEPVPIPNGAVLVIRNQGDLWEIADQSGIEMPEGY